MPNTYLKTKTRMEVYPCNPSAGEKETAGSLGLTSSHLAHLASPWLVREPSQKKKCGQHPGLPTGLHMWVCTPQKVKILQQYCLKQWN